MVRLSASRQNPNLENQASVFIPPETGLTNYSPGHWVVRAPQDSHFPYPIIWANGLYTDVNGSSEFQSRYM
jgi:hypothetical protein